MKYSEDSALVEIYSILYSGGTLSRHMYHFFKLEC